MGSRQNNNTPPPATDTEWLDFLTGNDVADDVSKILFPAFYWMNGKQELKATGGPGYTGGFVLPDDSGVVPEESSPWIRYTRVTKEGTEIAGFFASTLRITIIRERKRWLAPESNDRMRSFAWSDYEAAKSLSARVAKTPRGNVEALCHVEGIPGVVVFSVKGTGSMGFTDRSGWVADFRRNVIDPANRFARQKAAKTHEEACKAARAEGRQLPDAPRIALPMLRFWFRVGIRGMNADGTGAPIFEKVGTGNNVSFVTSPACLEPNAPCQTLERVSVFALPPTAFRPWESEYRSAEPWVEEWSETTLRRAMEAREAKPATPAYREPGAETESDDIPF